MTTWALTFKNLLLPIFCKECGLRLLTGENGYFCPTCWELSPRIQQPFCALCGQPHAGRAGFGQPGPFRCAACREKEEAPPYRRILGAAQYEGAVAASIKLLKFEEKRRLATSLGDLLHVQAAQELDTDHYTDLVPVPLHKIRLRERGFNQAALLAKEILPLFPNAELNESLIRIRPTRVQSKLKSEAERKNNVIGAFAVERGRDFKGRRILLIDDVVTSGGTVSECAAALKRAGAAHVDVLAVALPVAPELRTPSLN